MTVSPNSGVLKQMSKRLDNIETGINDMRTALVQVARTEEKVASLLEKYIQLSGDQKDLATRITLVEKADQTNTIWIGILKKTAFFFAIVVFGYAGAHPEQIESAIKIALGMM